MSDACEDCATFGSATEVETTTVTPEHVRSVRVGHGANCSSVGSVIDTLFLASTLGGAIFAAVCAALNDEDIKVVGRKPQPAAAPPPAKDDDEVSS